MKKISYKIFQKYISNIIIALALILVSFLTFQGGVVGVFSSNENLIYYNGNEKNNTVSLMFNVYMGNEYVEQILQVLEEKKVKATFFVGGIWVEKNNECFMNIYESGNEIASHGYWHKDHSKISDEQQANEILLTDDLVCTLTGLKMTLFAPPSGAFNKKTSKIAKELGYKTIMWSKDTIDWRDQDVDLIVKRATNKVKAGDLILMHPTKATADALGQIIDNILKQNLKINTVSSNIYIEI